MRVRLLVERWTILINLILNQVAGSLSDIVLRAIPGLSHLVVKARVICSRSVALISSITTKVPP